MAFLLKTLIAALLVVVSGAVMMVQHHTLKETRERADRAEQAVRGRDAIIVTLKATAARNKRELMKLEAARQRIAATLSARETYLENLQHDNATLRRWADTALPDALAGMREHPALTGADAYLQSLPASDTLPPAGGGAQDERRAQYHPGAHRGRLGHLCGPGGHDCRLPAEH